MRLFAALFSALAALCSMTSAQSSPEMYFAQLDAAQVVPPVSSAGVGNCTLSIDALGNVMVSGTFAGLSGNPILVFVRSAPVGTNGGDVARLRATWPKGSTGSGTISGAFTATTAQILSLRNGLWYITIDTGSFTGGEVRGQFLPSFMAFGTPHRPLGSAALSTDPVTGDLIVSNIGSSGNDGFEVDLSSIAPRMKGWGTSFRDGFNTMTVPQGAYRETHLIGTVNGQPDQVIFTTHVEAVGANVRYSWSSPFLANPTVTLRIFLGDNLINALPGYSGGFISLPALITCDEEMKDSHGET